jgi:LysM repeat protein
MPETGTDATATPLPTAIPVTEAAPLSDLEMLGTEAAITATAQAQGGTTGDTPDAGTTPLAPTVAAPTSSVGGEVLPPTNTPVGTLAAAEAQPQATTGCPAAHTVAGGENLYRIALRYGTTYQALAAANGIANPAQISVGTVLNIPGCGDAPAAGAAPAPAPVVPGTSPGGTTHVVQRGENLFRIALRYNMTWTTLAAYNGIANPNTLVVGQTLQIP